MKKIYILNPSKNRCVATGKQKHRNKKQAKKFAQILYYCSSYKERQKTKIMRTYQCEWCLKWHLTSKKKHN